jgi:hypothetical protein
MRDFKKLLIWQKAMEIIAASYEMAGQFPSEEKYGLRSQVTRCAVSIAANVAEGSSVDEERLSSLLKMLEEEEKMLTAFIKTLMA